MFGGFLKLLIFHVMVACAIKHWLRALAVLVKKISIILFVCEEGVTGIDGMCVLIFFNSNNKVLMFLHQSDILLACVSSPYEFRFLNVFFSKVEN